MIPFWGAKYYNIMSSGGFVEAGFLTGLPGPWLAFIWSVNPWKGAKSSVFCVDALRNGVGRRSVAFSRSLTAPWLNRTKGQGANMVYDLRALALDSQPGTLSPGVDRDCTACQAEDRGCAQRCWARPLSRTAQQPTPQSALPWGSPGEGGGRCGSSQSPPANWCGADKTNALRAGV